MAETLELVDIEKLVKETAEIMLDEDAKQKADLDKPDINWDWMFVIHGETLYTDTRRLPKPTAHMLYTANFHNATPITQHYTLHTERRTKSTCSIALMKTYSIGTSVEIKLIPPNPIVEANAGFQGEMSMKRGVREMFQQELVWAVDSKIEVPPEKVTKADLVIKEDEFDGDFTIETKFEGKVVVTYESKTQSDHVTTVIMDVTSFLTMDRGFKQDEQGRPSFVTRGNCKCRFGIEQSVLLKQMDLPAEEKVNQVLDEDCDL